ncbi:MAG TPA: hypothetical protein VMV25_03860 [Steroidobacteraceae bacterium]|nr:hypothetical protein [Steroidobacteraceae bacterium]
MSDKARACIGCGAPLTTASSLDLVPEHPNAPPPTRGQIKRRALWAVSMLVLGVIWASFLDHRPGSGRLASLPAALLIVGGLCWCLVLLVHAVSSRR